jgi:hypothetical protein
MDDKRADGTPGLALSPEKLARLKAAQEQALARTAERNARDERRYKWAVRLGIASAVAGVICIVLVITSAVANFPFEPTLDNILRGLLPAVVISIAFVLAALRWPKPKTSAGLVRTNALTEPTGADRQSLASKMHDMALQELAGLKDLRAVANKAMNPILGVGDPVGSDFEQLNKRQKKDS